MGALKKNRVEIGNWGRTRRYFRYVGDSFHNKMMLKPRPAGRWKCGPQAPMWECPWRAARNEKAAQEKALQCPSYSAGNS